MLQKGHNVSAEVNAEENSVQDNIPCSQIPEEPASDLWSYEQLDGK